MCAECYILALEHSAHLSFFDALAVQEPNKQADWWHSNAGKAMLERRREAKKLANVGH